MDIEKLLKELRRAERYCLNDYSRMAGEAATALSALQAENEKLRAELEQVKVERDAAGECINTVYSYILIKSKTDAVRTIEKWWRGPKED